MIRAYQMKRFHSPPPSSPSCRRPPSAPPYTEVGGPPRFARGLRVRLGLGDLSRIPGLVAGEAVVRLVARLVVRLLAGLEAGAVARRRVPDPPSSSLPSGSVMVPLLLGDCSPV